jgi:uncharacterized membrane-anchored protein
MPLKKHTLLGLVITKRISTEGKRIMNRTLSILGIFLILTLFVGCATKPSSFGEKVLSEGESRIEIAQIWELGKKESKKGEDQILKGRTLVEKGRADLRQGEKLIEEGNTAVQKNRKAYQDLSQINQEPNSSASATSNVKKLEKIAEAWKDAEKKILEGHKRIKRGNDRISEGETKISKGQNLLETGRAKMQEAEKSYQKAYE